MNSEFIWGMIITVVCIIIIGVGIALYFFWKDRDDYDKEKKVIVWSIVAAGALGLLFGIIFVIWGASKKESTDATKKIIEESKKNQQNSKEKVIQEAHKRAQKLYESTLKQYIPPEPIIGPPKPYSSATIKQGPLMAKLYSQNRKPKGILKKGKNKKSPAKKVTFAGAGSSSTE